ncbi:hypothetical protein P43SY_004524 [Pythium insidiosum]|uniref:Zinc finger PHD-type domain-containing protein n=1 Tax=Pythium insidiosum TaxID=114742 RepID=A0AAD5Q940_PYTIN|nr:hypothetical protein P43SY_004524 [Pythium insidiosum]
MTVACPVCALQFDEGATFALHVAACTTPLSGTAPGTPSTVSSTLPVTASSCPMCHMVYTSVMLAHEIEFHEFECERINPRPDVNAAVPTGASSTGSAGAVSGGKRSRESLDAADVATPLTATTGPTVKLFPSHCAICDTGGRTLLHCAGRCARSFHPMCIDDINQRPVAFPSSVSTSPTPSLTASAFVSNISRDRKSMRQWVCGDCTRGVHACQLCGFLGHDVHDLVHCSVTDCGFSFHPACLADRSFRSQLPLVCPRHTCATCHAIETDLSKCSSCTRCCHATHFRCGANASTAAPSDLLDPNFRVCDSHSQGNLTPAATTSRRVAQNIGLKMRLRPGDVVLVLEYNNRLLPESATRAAPTACNQWGIVQRVEELSTTTTWYWNQLLSVTLFSDGSEISVLNRDVLAVGAVAHFSAPVELLRECLKWHAMGEARLLGQRQLAVAATSSAFHARVRALAMTDSQCSAAAAAGVDRHNAFEQASARVFGQVEAPVHVMLDTRPRSNDELTARAILSASTPAADGESNDSSPPSKSPGSGGDVEITDATGESTSSKGSHSGLGRQHRADGYAVHSDVAAVMNSLLSTLEAANPLSPAIMKPIDQKMNVDAHETKGEPGVDLKRRLPSDHTAESSMKRVKREPPTVRFTHLPVKLQKKPGSVFTHSPGLPVPTKSRKLREQMTSLPSALIADLEQQVGTFLGECVSTGGSLPLPMLRPAFYRPSPFLYCGPRLRQQRRIDSISRLLLCQDKRNVKCFVQNGPYADCRGLTRYMSIDLLAHGDVAALQGEIGSRLSGEVVAPTRLRELRYCTYDGGQHALMTDADWLCFCASVCHLIAIVA